MRRTHRICLPFTSSTYEIFTQMFLSVRQNLFSVFWFISVLLGPLVTMLSAESKPRGQKDRCSPSWKELDQMVGCISSNPNQPRHIKYPSSRRLTSFSALTVQTPYVAASIAPNKIAVLPFHFAGLVHQPPDEGKGQSRWGMD